MPEQAFGLVVHQQDAARVGVQQHHRIGRGLDHQPETALGLVAPGDVVRHQDEAAGLRQRLVEHVEPALVELELETLRLALQRALHEGQQPLRGVLAQHLGGRAPDHRVRRQP